MKMISFLLLLFLSASAGAQEKLTATALTGTWVFKEMTLAGVKHEFAGNKTVIPDRLAPAFASIRDSAQLVQICNMVFELVDDLELTYSAKGQYRERYPDGLIREGVFTVDEASAKIFTRVDGQIEEVKAALRAGELVLFKTVEGELPMEVTLRRTK